MKKEIQQLECLSQISSAIIDNPTFSIANFGIGRASETCELMYTGSVNSNVRLQYESIANTSVALTGAEVVATGNALSTIGLETGAAGASAPGSGFIAKPPFPINLIGDYFLLKKREQEVKDRMYKELIAKQQAAINKQKQIYRELEEKLRDQNATTEQLKMEVARLKQEIANLKELIEILTEQINQFNQAA